VQPLETEAAALRAALLKAQEAADVAEKRTRALQTKVSEQVRTY
jgi:hypothetical protein